VPEVLAVFGRAFELTGGTLHLELHDVIANDEHAVALYTARGERAGRRLEDRTVQVWHIRDGKRPGSGFIQRTSTSRMSSGPDTICTKPKRLEQGPNHHQPLYYHPLMGLT
jgi:hypothetical protein